VLIRQLTRQQLLPSRSMAKEGIEDGETLIVDFGRIVFEGTFYSDKKPRNDSVAVIHNLTAIIENTGKRILIEEMVSNVTVQELLEALAYKINLPSGTQSVLIRQLTRQQLLPSQSLAEKGIEDGETLIADFERTAGGGYIVRSYRDIQIINAYLKHNLVATYHSYAVYAIILYTAADKNLSSFVHDSFTELHHLAGQKCAFFVIERPVPKWIPLMREELTNNLGPYIERVWSLLEKNQFSAVDSSTIYEIANRMGIKRAQLPCICFFTNLDSKEMLVVSLSSLLDKRPGNANQQDFLYLFRDVFDRVEIAAQKRENERLDRLKREINSMKRGRAVQKIEEHALPETIKGLIGTVIKIILM